MFCFTFNYLNFFWFWFVLGFEITKKNSLKNLGKSLVKLSLQSEEYSQMKANLVDLESNKTEGFSSKIYCSNRIDGDSSSSPDEENVRVSPENAVPVEEVESVVNEPDVGDFVTEQQFKEGLCIPVSVGTVDVVEDILKWSGSLKRQPMV